MATKLKDYQANMADKVPEPLKPAPSGVACPQATSKTKCRGQMLWREPRERHPTLPLDRADCSYKKCGYMGWV